MEKRLVDYKDLTRQQKMEHIWEYYKLHIIAGVIVLWFIGWMLNHYIINPPAEITLDVSVFAEYAVTEELDALNDVLDAAVFEEGVNEESVVDFLSTAENLDPQMQQAVVTRMVAKASLNDYDIMIFEGDFYMNFLMEGVLMPMDALIRSGGVMVDGFELLSGGAAGYEGEEVYLIDVTSHEGIKRIIQTEEKLYVAIHGYTENIDNVVKGLNFILNSYK